MCANLQAKGLARAVSSDLADTSCCNALIYISDSFIRPVTNRSLDGSHYYWSKIATSYQLGGKIGIRETTYHFQVPPYPVAWFFRGQKRAQKWPLWNAPISRLGFTPKLSRPVFRQKMAIFGTPAFRKYQNTKWIFMFNFPKNRPKKGGFRVYLHRFLARENGARNNIFAAASQQLNHHLAPTYPSWIGFSFCFLLENGWSGVGRARTQ